MEGSRIGLLVSRALQLIFAVIVLGVAASLAVDFSNLKSECDADNDLNSSSCNKGVVDAYLNKPQSSIEYAAFTGAWGVLGALITLVAVFVDAVPWIVAVVFDALACIFYFAGGINNAVQRADDDLFQYFTSSYKTKWDATTAFMFLAFIVSVGALVLVLLGRRSGGVRHSTV